MYKDALLTHVRASFDLYHLYLILYKIYKSALVYAHNMSYTNIMIILVGSAAFRSGFGTRSVRSFAWAPQTLVQSARIRW